MRKYLFITILACSVLFLMAASAMAFGEIRYPDRPLNLRDGRSASAKWVGSLYPGQKVRVAFLEDGWVAVFEPNETRNSEDAAVGFSNVKYLLKKRTRHEPKPWGERMVTTRKLNIRTDSSVRGEKVGLLEVDELVIVDFPEDDWVMIFSPHATIRSKMNARGFSSAKYLEPAPAGRKAAPAPAVVATPKSSEASSVAGTAAPQPAPTKQESEDWGRVLTVKRKVNVRQERTSSSHYVRTLQPGDKVRVDFLKQGWYAVFNEEELIHSEQRAIGYALQSLLESDGSSEPVKTAAPAPASKPIWKETKSGRKTMDVNKPSFKKTRRPDPTPNATVHGYQYRLLDKTEMKRYGETWIVLKVFLSTRRLPGNDALRDFANTLWEEHKRATRNLALMVYLPGQDTDDLSYAVIQYSNTKLLEFWTRRTTLFGTDFM